MTKIQHHDLDSSY